MSVDDEEGAAVWRSAVQGSAAAILATRVYPPSVTVNGGAEWVAVCGEPGCTARGGPHRETSPFRCDVVEAIALHIARVHWPGEDDA